MQSSAQHRINIGLLNDSVYNHNEPLSLSKLTMFTCTFPTAVMTRHDSVGSLWNCAFTIFYLKRYSDTVSMTTYIDTQLKHYLCTLNIFKYKCLKTIFFFIFYESKVPRVYSACSECSGTLACIHHAWLSRFNGVFIKHTNCFLLFIQLSSSDLVEILCSVYAIAIKLLSLTRERELRNRHPPPPIGPTYTPHACATPASALPRTRAFKVGALNVFSTMTG